MVLFESEDQLSAIRNWIFYRARLHAYLKPVIVWPEPPPLVIRNLQMKKKNLTAIGIPNNR